MKKQILHCFYLVVSLAAFSLFAVPAYSQEKVNAHLIKYRFSVQDVTDPASAKEMTDYIRPLFNTEEKPFGYFPWYNQTSKQFEFQSAVSVTEAELDSVLQQKGLELISFSSAVVESNTRER